MYYLIIQIFKQEYLDDIMLALTSADIDNGTIVDGINSDNILNQHIPIFTGLIPNEGTSSVYCKIVNSVIDSLEKVDVLLDIFRDADINFVEDGIGRIIVLPTARVLDANVDWKEK